MKVLFNLTQISEEFSVFKANKFWYAMNKSRRTYHSYAQLHHVRKMRENHCKKSRAFKRELRKRDHIQCTLCKTTLKLQIMPRFIKLARNVEQQEIHPLHKLPLSRLKVRAYCWIGEAREIGIPLFQHEKRGKLARMCLAATAGSIPITQDLTKKKPICLNCICSNEIEEVWQSKLV